MILLSCTQISLMPSIMQHSQKQLENCFICGKSQDIKQLIPFDMVRNGVSTIIKKTHPQIVENNGFVCVEDLNRYRGQYVEDALKKQKGELSALERRVIKGLNEHEIIAQNINQAFDRQLTFGEKIADKVAAFGGSWMFIISFGLVLLIWVVTNSFILIRAPFDPYPYILLNLLLSSLAALQAPVIMMSQNRQEDRDRLRSEEDYRVNLKAELEIRHLNEKIDQLLGRQWQRLLEIQQIQLDLMEEMVSKKVKSTHVIATAPVITPSSKEGTDNKV